MRAAALAATGFLLAPAVAQEPVPMARTFNVQDQGMRPDLGANTPMPTERPDLGGRFRGMTKPLYTQMMPGGEEGAAAADGFVIRNDVNAAIAFLLVPSADSKATTADRRSLASAGSGTFRCGRPTCQVRFLVDGAIRAETVTQGRGYHFYFVGGRLGLYPLRD